MERSAGTMVTPNVRLVRPLGQGGMGSVWVADHLTLETQVAVKFITADSIGQEGRTRLTRFRREAKAAVKIRSPHVVQIFDYGIMDDGSPYIVMELLEGETFGARIQRSGSVSPDETIEVIAQVAKALSAAHHLGIVHRDIKPDNIFLTTTHDGELLVKVLDFGVAKQSGLGVDQDLTSTGSMVGSPKYMSPEQLLSHKDVGPSADMWALAVVAYRGLTGVAPFQGATLAALSITICNAEYQPPTALRTDLPPALNAWFERAFRRDPEQRFGSLKELVRELRTALFGTVDPLADSSGSFAAVGAELAGEAPAPRLAPPAEEPPGRSRSKASDAAAPAVAGAIPPPAAAPVPSPEGPSHAAVDPGGARPPTPSASRDDGEPLDGPAAEAEPGRRRLDSSALPVPQSPLPSPAVAAAARDPGSWSGSMASLGGASASLQPALPPPARRRLVVIGMAGVAATLLALIIVISVSLGEESGPAAAATVPSARVGLPGTDLSVGPLLGAAQPDGFVAVAAGTYPVGCDAKGDAGCFEDEQPRHEAKLERYGIMRHEVTVGEYRRCVAAGGCDAPSQGPGCPRGSSADPSWPVRCVTFADAQAYCRFRGARLPTESEWEAAARGPAAQRFPWGDGPPSCARTVVGGCGHQGPRPVGSKSADRSWAGVFDLGGNVREWTASDYGAYPGGRRDRDRVGKITRGTSYRIAPADADTSYNRGVDEPDQARPDLGFRCAASL